MRFLRTLLPRLRNAGRALMGRDPIIHAPLEAVYWVHPKRFAQLKKEVAGRPRRVETRGLPLVAVEDPKESK